MNIILVFFMVKQLRTRCMLQWQTVYYILDNLTVIWFQKMCSTPLGNAFTLVHIEEIPISYNLKCSTLNFSLDNLYSIERLLTYDM